MKAYIIMKSNSTLMDESIGVCFNEERCVEKIHRLNDPYLDWVKEKVKPEPDWHYIKEVEVLG